jgi:hypothetical protein
MAGGQRPTAAMMAKLAGHVWIFDELFSAVLGSDLRQLASHPLAPLVCFSLIASAMLAAYVVAGHSPSPTFVAVMELSCTFLLAYWVILDARKGHRIPCFDFGLYCYLLLPVTLPWYCFWSRGWRGIILLIALFGTVIAPYFVESVVWGMLYGS